MKGKLAVIHTARQKESPENCGSAQKSTQKRIKVLFHFKDSLRLFLSLPPHQTVLFLVFYKRLNCIFSEAKVQIIQDESIWNSINPNSNIPMASHSENINVSTAVMKSYEMLEVSTLAHSLRAFSQYWWPWLRERHRAAPGEGWEGL